ncbi:2-dehydro-3-deoxy-6-phosphogalactonate aldolase [Novosphingobium sp. KACC 22771]|uniref:2-dehydro-3-deoxy-6-phosphogalactonate aldolase n=1 Tax=Novosphingobium sp. KACC 22771 TaxID=3025670 RepID=UPI00236554BE|nr:2-dehydro-3-deoxy-6-phosphogalactonate aldolase [Novosphingobium sp. KACC 22771]WDF74814.1 2-dehydro-3-deoxy-6-phosphogalactonate aldolase [Novosphingobium sp. KACC 22771]
MNTPLDTLNAALAVCPLVAILRGVRPDEVEAIGDAIIDAGFSMIEVPLNSPDPLASIALLAKRCGPQVLVGAGTVLTTADVADVKAAGGTLIISPNVNTDVIRASVAAGMISLPGFYTPTEAFAALEAGATGLKLFPAEGASPAYMKAQRAVLPKDLPLLAVGGVTPDNLAQWRAAGAQGAGLGSALYQAGLSAAEVGERARAFVAACG